MCNIGEAIELNAIYKGIAIGEKETRKKDQLEYIRSLIRNMHLTVKDAMDVLEIPEEARKELTEILEAENKTAD